MRLDNLIKCFQTIDALNQRNGITAKELQHKLKCSLKTAYRYLDAASLVLNVTADGYPQRFKLNEPIGCFDKIKNYNTQTRNVSIARAVAYGIKTT
jgi:hypothetical protein